MILPLSAVWAAAHGVFRALGFGSRLFDAAGRTVHLYERKGSGKGAPILMVHGLGGAALSFLPVARRLLRASSRVVVIELPGHGRARLGPKDLPATIVECGQALGAALLELGEPAVLIGNSLGGALSLHTAAALPAQVRGVVGLNPAGAPLAGADREVVVAAFRGGSMRAAMELNRRLYSRPPRAQWLVARGLARHFSSPVVRQLVGELRNDVPGISAEVLRRIQVPVLILWGEDDRLLPGGSVAWFRENLPAAAVEVLPATGHLPMVEQSALVGARIARFLEELP